MTLDPIIIIDSLHAAQENMDKPLKSMKIEAYIALFFSSVINCSSTFHIVFTCHVD